MGSTALPAAIRRGPRAEVVPVLLALDNARKRFGSTRTLDPASQARQPGEVHALVGRNGAVIRNLRGLARGGGSDLARRPRLSASRTQDERVASGLLGHRVRDRDQPEPARLLRATELEERGANGARGHPPIRLTARAGCESKSARYRTLTDDLQRRCRGSLRNRFRGSARCERRALLSRDPDPDRPRPRRSRHARRTTGWCASVLLPDAS